MIALNAERGTLCVALEERTAVGGKSKYGAITMTSITTTSHKPTNLAQNKSKLKPTQYNPRQKINLILMQARELAYRD
jgi:hypothetical protein